MLTGQYRTVIDEKGRVIIPSRLRSSIPGTSIVVTAGIDRCLWVFIPETWSSISDRLMTQSPFLYQSRLLQRRIVAPAQEVELDKMGRVLIPQNLQHVAGLMRECVLHGLKKYIEIWDSQEYENYLESHENDFLEAAEKLGGVISL